MAKWTVYVQKNCQYSDGVVKWLTDAKENVEVLDVSSQGHPSQLIARGFTRTPIVYLDGYTITNGYAYVRDRYIGTPIESK